MISDFQKKIMKKHGERMTNAFAINVDLIGNDGSTKNELDQIIGDPVALVADWPVEIQMLSDNETEWISKADFKMFWQHDTVVPKRDQIIKVSSGITVYDVIGIISFVPDPPHHVIALKIVGD